MHQQSQPPTNYQNLSQQQPIIKINPKLDLKNKYSRNQQQNNITQSYNISSQQMQQQKYINWLNYKSQQFTNRFTDSLYYISIFVIITILFLLFTLHLTNTWHLTLAQLGIYASYISWILSIGAVICSIYFWIRIRIINHKLD